VWDVLKVRYILRHKVVLPLPEELVDWIIDEAEYWASTEVSMRDKRLIHKDRDQVILKTVPLCYDRASLESCPSSPSPTPLIMPHRSKHPCRKIIFHISSHDQGSGNRQENVYEGSWTWFDTEVIRAAHLKNIYQDGEEQEVLENEKGQVAVHYGSDHPKLLPRGNKLQMNATRVSEMQDHTIVWHYLDDIAPDSLEAEEIERTQGRGRDTLDGRGVRELAVGDSIAVWARARFPGWSNTVAQARVVIFWAI
jgi:hypothetical protein